MGFLEKLLGGHHGGSRHGGHHGDDHQGGYRKDNHGWGHGSGNPGGCDNNGFGKGVSPGGNDGRATAGNMGSVACPNCPTQNASGARFCQQCGASLIPAKCTQCGATVQSNSKFCGQCGKASG